MQLAPTNACLLLYDCERHERRTTLWTGHGQWTWNRVTAPGLHTENIDPGPDPTRPKLLTRWPVTRFHLCRAFSLRYVCIRRSGIVLIRIGCLYAKFRFFCGLYCWASPWTKSRTQSLTRLIWCAVNRSFRFGIHRLTVKYLVVVTILIQSAKWSMLLQKLFCLNNTITHVNNKHGSYD